MRKILCAVAFLISAVTFAQKPVFTAAKVKAATVYYNGAELLQSASVNLPSGTSEIVIKNVADYLNENTIRIGTPASVTVLSVQFTRNYISEFEPDENSPQLKKVRDSITLVSSAIGKLQIEKVSLSKTIDLLDKNQQVSGLNSGLSVAELMKMVDYYKAKRSEINYSITDIQAQENKLNAKLQQLNNRLQVNTDKEEKTSSGKLVLQVMNNVAGMVALDISYITNAAGWKPFYDLRAENIAAPITMMYKAQLLQNTGVDWKKVKLTLSSGNPNQNNLAPELRPWFLQYGHLNAAIRYDKDEEDDKKALSETVVVSQLAGKVSGLSITDYTTIVENQLNVSFDIDILYDILSNGKAHSVALKEIKLPATYNYYAAPRIDSEAFLLAGISDYSKYNLLPGEANIIFEGMYVGKTMINPNQTADTLQLSMGRDKKISITREKVAEKSGTRFLSAYKEQTFTFDIIVRNNKKEAVAILLKDQIPLSQDKEVTIELQQHDKAKANAETGILEWEFKLAPNENKKLRISYKVKYPKDKILDNL